MPKEEKVEIWSEDPEEEVEEEIIDGERVYEFHCKPCYNFQSIEFDFVGTIDDVPEMMEMYERLVLLLQDIAPDQVGSKQPVEYATEKQKVLLQRLGIKADKKLTKEQAKQLIKEKLGD